MNSKGTILLVEDNADDEALTLRAFKKNGIANPIVVVRDGAEALDYLFARNNYQDRTPAELPAVVLLDLNLPKLGGIDVLRQIRSDERTRRLPVVVLTSSKEERDLISCYDSGANSYVKKPVDFVNFMVAVRQLGMYWLVLNQSPPR